MNSKERKKVLIILAHPRTNSLNHGIKAAVQRGLTRQGAETRVQDLYREKFDPVLHDVETNDRDLTTVRMQENVRWADWLVFVTPMWWANVPAMLKGYFDRVFTENFAFRYSPAGIPAGLLGRKKALLIATSDTPGPVLSLSGRTAGFKSILSGVFRLCGIAGARYKIFGSVRSSTENKRARWIEKAEAIGEAIARPESGLRRLAKTLVAIIKAVRLPLYSFVLFPVLLGAAVGAFVAGAFNLLGFVAAALIGLLGHSAVSLSNEVADEPIDRRNPNRTMFNGGTGLLAQGRISKQTLTAGWIAASLATLAAAAAMVLLCRSHWLLLASVGLPLFLGLEYSFPPLRLSRIGLGEAAAFVAYGAPSLLLGFLLQRAAPADLQRTLGDWRFYLVALPAALAVTVTLCLTQIPDTEVDKANGKKSVSVLLGPQKVLVLSVVLLGLCIAAFVLLVPLHLLPLGYGIAGCILPSLTGALILRSPQVHENPAGMRMINIMGLAVTTAVSCALLPAVYYLANIGRTAPFGA